MDNYKAAVWRFHHFGQLLTNTFTPHHFRRKIIFSTPALFKRTLDLPQTNKCSIFPVKICMLNIRQVKKLIF